MKQELTSIAQKIGELEMERDEHNLVIETLTPLPKDRTCFRLVGGVLVERNVEQVLPAVVQNRDGIQQIMKTLGQSYANKEKDVQEYQKTWNIKVKAQ